MGPSDYGGIALILGSYDALPVCIGVEADLVTIPDLGKLELDLTKVRRDLN